MVIVFNLVMHVATLLKATGFAILLEFLHSIEGQCHPQITSNATVQRLFERYRVNHKEAKQIWGPSIHSCHHLCNLSFVPNCRAFTYTYSNGICYLFNATNLKHHLVEREMTVTVIIMPEHCKNRTYGTWSSWNIIESRRESPGWSSDFYHRWCLDSAKDCNDPLCIHGRGNYTIFCKNIPCQDDSNAVIVNKTGIHDFSISDNQVPLYVEVDENSIAWIHIQRRFDGSVDFYRNWTSYKKGFGDVSREFWLGNDIIHELTKAGNAMMRIDLFGGNKWRHAQYDNFQIEDESERYLINSHGYSGNVGNSLPNGYRFSTYDSDNDVHDTLNCAAHYKGAWWFHGCHASHLNGLFLNDSTIQFPHGMTWRSKEGYYRASLQTVMKIRFH